MEIIAEYGTILLALAVIFGLYMTWGIGANDVANAMGTSVGSGAITVKQAIVIAAIFEFAGAFIAGGNVTSTIRKGIIDPTSIANQPEILVFGMLAALLAAGVWLMLASTRGWPVSTPHSIVGALVGFTVAGIGVDAVHWGKIGQIAASWVISPVLGGFLAYMLMMSIRKFILDTEHPFESARRWGPVYVFLVGFIISLVTLFKGLKHLNLEMTIPMSFLAALVFGAFIAAIGWVLIQKVEVDPEADRDYHFASVEKIFVPMMIFTACAMAFAHGSNDVANGIGPLAAVASIIIGYRVMQTIGTRITQLTPSRGFCATLAAAATVVLASRTGLPVSTTHIAVGAVVGVGMARGLDAIDLRVIGGIIVSWVITLPAGGILAALFFFTLKGMFS